MQKRVQIALAVVFVALVSVASWQVLRLREPVYQGKRLSFWLNQYASELLRLREPVYQGKGVNLWVETYYAASSQSESRSGELENQAETAIRHIGTDAVPICLELLASTDSPLKLKILALVGPRWPTLSYRRSAHYRRILGVRGLIALGTDAKPAVPALAVLLNDKNPDVRRGAVFVLRSLDPLSGDVWPSVTKSLNDPLAMDRQGGVSDLLRNQPREQVIPLLAELLAEPPNPQHSVMMRANAIWALRRFGVQAKPVFPVLLRCLSDSEQIIRTEATSALLTIDPEAAARAGEK